MGTEPRDLVWQTWDADRIPDLTFGLSKKQREAMFASAEDATVVSAQFVGVDHEASLAPRPTSRAVSTAPDPAAARSGGTEPAVARRASTAMTPRMLARWFWCALIGSIAAASGCKFPEPPDVEWDANPDQADARADGATGCEPDTIVCDDETGQYTECSADGTVNFEMDCPLGCSAAVEKCLDVDPSNSLASRLDMARFGPDVHFMGDSVIDSEGNAFNGPEPLEIPFESAAGMAVYSFKSLTISGTL